MQGYGKQRTHKNILSPRNRKKVLPQGCRKANQLQSVQGYGKQRTHKNILSPRNRKKVLPWQHLLPGIIEKLISSNACRGLECKEPRERLLSPRNMKKCSHTANQLQSVQGIGKQRTHKNIFKSKKQKKVLPGIVEKLISSNPWFGVWVWNAQNQKKKRFLSPRNMKKCCHGNTCCQILPRKQSHTNSHAIKPPHQI